MNIIKIKSTASTNDFLKELLRQQTLEEGTVVFAENQTAGKGQRGNSWESEHGKNITCSILLYPHFLPVKQHFLLSEVVALGIKSALDLYIDSIEIKWPNDIYHEGKKMAGVLIENELTGDHFTRSVVGIGLNVNQEIFLSDAPNPVSMKQVLKRDLNLENVLEDTVKSIWTWYGKLESGGTETIVRNYHDSLYRKDGLHAYSDSKGPLTARIHHVEDDGRLHLITDEGEERCYAFKEVVFQQHNK
jgi:BirA family biotin operon repressor/biotin-[acetyl-CoA-carboxylase] ligase